MNEQKCPCGSGQSYSACCQPFHQGIPAGTALQLMRSRYSAYALCLPDYIMQTTHPDHSQCGSNRALWKQEILTFCKQTEFRKLDILDFQPKEKTATVTFFAHLFQNNKDVSFTEKSLFKKVNGTWLYHSGQIR